MITLGSFIVFLLFGGAASLMMIAVNPVLRRTLTSRGRNVALIALLAIFLLWPIILVMIIVQQHYRHDD